MTRVDLIKLCDFTAQQIIGEIIRAKKDRGEEPDLVQWKTNTCFLQKWIRVRVIRIYPDCGFRLKRVQRTLLVFVTTVLFLLWQVKIQCKSPKMGGKVKGPFFTRKKHKVSQKQAQIVSRKADRTEPRVQSHRISGKMCCEKQAGQEIE